MSAIHINLQRMSETHKSFCQHRFIDWCAAKHFNQLSWFWKIFCEEFLRQHPPLHWWTFTDEQRETNKQNIITVSTSISRAPFGTNSDAAEFQRVLGIVCQQSRTTTL